VQKRRTEHPHRLARADGSDVEFVLPEKSRIVKTFHAKKHVCDYNREQNGVHTSNITTADAQDKRA
jgi:hypothetical protein